MVLFKGKYIIKQVRINKAANRGKGQLLVTIPMNNPQGITKGDFIEIRPLHIKPRKTF